MLTELFKEARKRSRRNQGGFTLVELLVVIAILGILAAIVLFNISGVNASAACNAMKTDGGTLQAASDIYFNTYNVYPVGTAAGATLPGATDVASPAGGSSVNVAELLKANLLHQAPPTTETFTYNATPNGTVHGALSGATCTYN